jgi:hypothetical protein
MKFASKRVNGWKTRWEHPMKVQEALWTRQANGYHLDLDERTFLEDVASLRGKYNAYTFAKALLQGTKEAA